MHEDSPIMHSAEVNQAAGMVSVQANCRMDEAFTLMSERAESAGVSPDDVAVAELDHSIAFR